MFDRLGEKIYKNLVGWTGGGGGGLGGLLYVRGLKEYVCMLRVTSHDIPPGPLPGPSCSKGE